MRYSFRREAYHVLSNAYLILIAGLPLLFVLLIVRSLSNFWIRGVAVVLAPILYAAFMAFAAGLLSMPHRRFIKPGRLRRRLEDRVYFHRRLYGLCWTTLYYAKPVYYICLSIPVLKRITFRLFGYRGSMNFTIYPDTWIRDLPLLNFSDGVYLSNRATLGTNLVLGNNILVDRINLGKDVVIGHLAMLAPGVHVGNSSEIGVGSVIGIKVRVGAGCIIGGGSALESGAEIGDEVQIGGRSFIAARAKVGSRVSVPRAAYVAPDQDVNTTSENAGPVCLPNLPNRGIHGQAQE